MRLEMFAAAENLDFEKAARLRDELKRLQAAAGGGGASEEPAPSGPYPSSGKRKTSASPKAGTAKAGGARNGRRYKAR